MLIGIGRMGTVGIDSTIGNEGKNLMFVHFLKGFPIALLCFLIASAISYYGFLTYFAITLVLITLSILIGKEIDERKDFL